MEVEAQDDGVLAKIIVRLRRDRAWERLYKALSSGTVNIRANLVVFRPTQARRMCQ